jgi:hypothetical protein
MVGASIAAIHLVLCLAIFASVQSSSDGQAPFAWMLLDAPWLLLNVADYSLVSLAYRFREGNPLIGNLLDWWYSVGNHQGPNIKALLMYGIFGSAQWFLIGVAAAAFLSYLCSWRKRTSA